MSPSSPTPPERASLVPWLLVGAVIAGIMLGAFLAIEALDVPILTDPSDRLGRAGVAGAALGVGLLVLDVGLPVPSSLVMTAHGALYGAALGTALSTAGGLGAALVGFGLGRSGTRVLDRALPAATRARAEAMLARHGALVVVASRPVPLLAETVSLLAGASRMRARAYAAAALAGVIPTALVYGVAGAYGAAPGHSFLVFGLVMVVAGAAWLLGRRSVTRP